LKILIDECVPWPIHRLLSTHTCKTAQQIGWAGRKNGELLKLAETNGFDLFITADLNIINKTWPVARLQSLSFLQTNYGASKRLQRLSQAQFKPSVQRILSHWTFHKAVDS
jgi:hypothetical protein